MPAHWLGPTACPVDGAISQPIAGDQIFRPRGPQLQHHRAGGGDTALASEFEGGHFATIYLSRATTTASTCLATGCCSMVYVPGDLFSVNPATARGVPGLLPATAGGVRV